MADGTLVQAGSGNAAVRLGMRLPGDGLIDQPAARVVAGEAALEPHVGMPWMEDHLREWHGIQSGGDAPAIPRRLDMRLADLDKHAFIVGGSGSGKTFFGLHLLYEQMEAGCSAVVMDVKRETVLGAAECALRAGMSPADITLILPGGRDARVPRWNPLAGPDPAKAADAFVDSMRAVFAKGWGDRMEDLLRSACTVAGAQGLSVYEAMELLSDERYRAALLAKAQADGAYERYYHQHEALGREFGALSPAERLNQSRPVTTKIREWLTNDWLRGMVCADGDDLDVRGLFEKQRLIGVHLDSDALGEDRTQILAGTLTRRLRDESVAQHGPVPVVLFLDELDEHERNVGDALQKIMRRARSQGLRLVCATQTFSSVSPDLRDLLMTAYVRAFFRLAPDDAPKVARALSEARGTQHGTVALSAKYVRGMPVEETWSCPITDQDGQRVAVPLPAWQAAMARHDAARAVTSLLGILGVQGANVRGWPLEACLGRLPNGWASFTGPDPLSLVARFPRPELETLHTVTESDFASELSRLIQSFPQRACVLRLATGITALVQTPFLGLTGLPAHVLHSVCETSQTPDEAEAAWAKRRYDASQLALRGSPAAAQAPRPPAQPRIDPGTDDENVTFRQGRDGSL